MANKKAEALNLLVSTSLVKPLQVSIINIAKKMHRFQDSEDVEFEKIDAFNKGSSKCHCHLAASTDRLYLRAASACKNTVLINNNTTHNKPLCSNT